MKKYFLMLAATLFAFAACQDPIEPDPGTEDPGTEEPGKEDPKKEEPSGPTTFALTSDAVVNIGAESEIAVVKFSAPAAWTASLIFPDEEGDYVVLAKESGDAGEVELKVTVQSLPEEIDGRYFDLVVKCGSDEADVRFYQGNVFIISQSWFEFGLDGGTAVFTLTSNLEYEITTYDVFDWAPFTFNEETREGTFKVAASKAYDARTAYVKFTVPAIQDPVYDEETGEDTGETKDHVVRVYVVQEGTLQVGWVQQFFWDMFPYGTRESIAVAGDYLLINCQKTEYATGGLLVCQKSDGAPLGMLDLPSLTGVTNDDAGNLVISAGGNYPIDPETWAFVPDQQIPLELFVIPAENIAAFLSGEYELTPFITYYNGFYGYGLDNLRVTGDVLSDAVITMTTSAGYGDFYAVDWEIKGGTFQDAGYGYTSYIAYPNFLPSDYSMGIWNSYSLVGMHLGNTASSALYYMGYDNNYNLQYLSGPGAEWQEVLVSGATWEEGFTTFAMAEWNGHKYLSFVGVPYFAWADWDGDGNVDGYLPGHLWLVNIDDPANPVVESYYEYYCDSTNWQYGDCADVFLTVEDGNLVAYMVDAASSQYMKVVYPK